MVYQIHLIADNVGGDRCNMEWWTWSLPALTGSPIPGMSRIKSELFEGSLPDNGVPFYTALPSSTFVDHSRWRMKLNL
jgi:hypothetical protein